MRYPDFIKPGDSIGFIAPSFGCATEPYVSCFKASIERFGAMGFKTVCGPNCFAAEGVGKSNTPEKCGAEINEFLTDGNISAVISCGGGETMCEDLPYVDFGAIQGSKPKWFMGYSDNTNLTFTLPLLCDTAAVYGPNAPAFGARTLHASLNDALSILRGEKLTVKSYPLWERESLKSEEDPFAPYNLTEPNGTFAVSGDGFRGRAVSFSGRLIGGCLDSLINLAGTPWGDAAAFAEKYASDGIIWFVEACDLLTMGIRRALWQLRSAGWFRHVSGFIVGRPYEIDDRFGSEGPQEAVLAALGDLGVPVILDADLGHLPPSMPLISGACADVSCADGMMSVKHYLT